MAALAEPASQMEKPRTQKKDNSFMEGVLSEIKLKDKTFLRWNVCSDSLDSAMLENLIRDAREQFDLTDPAHQESVIALAEEFLDQPGPVGEILAAAGAVDAPLEARIAGLLADSRHWLKNNADRKLKLGVVFAMWGEQNRLLPRSADNPTGEDSLATKLAQLDWATRGTVIDWTLYAVDDGCPHRSGALAREIAEAHPLRDRVRVLDLADALPASDVPLRGLASPDDSRKAGAVILGCDQALADGADAVIYTDADNSVHLGQIGLLLRPFIDSDAPVVLGDRKRTGSVLVKEGARWGIGIKILRHMQRMIGHAVFSRGILDTQAAFKLYASDLLAEIIAEPTVYDFSFDTDWILKAIRNEADIAQVPFAFIDSAAESASITQGPMTTWETLLFGLIKAVRRHGFCDGDAARMAAVVEDEIGGYRDLEKIIDLLPPELEHAGENDFGDPALMDPEALRAWLRGVLA